jgi:hypothetical protein
VTQTLVVLAIFERDVEPILSLSLTPSMGPASPHTAHVRCQRTKRKLNFPNFSLSTCCPSRLSHSRHSKAGHAHSGSPPPC